MDVTCETAELARAAKAAARCANAKEPMNGALIEVGDDVRIFTLDGAGVCCVASCVGKTKAPGRTVVDAAILAAVVADMGESVRLRLKDRRLEVTSDGADTKIPTRDPDTMPTFPPMVAVSPLLAMSADELGNWLGRAAYAASDNPAEAAMRRGVYLESLGGKLRATATDGHRLARAVTDSAAGLTAPVFAPAAALLVAVKACTGETRIGLAKDGRAIIECAGLLLALQMLDAGSFPDVQPLLDSAPIKLRAKVKRDKLIDALRRVARIRPADASVTLTFSGAQLRLTSTSAAGDAVVDLPCEWEGKKPFTVSANGNYVAEAIGTMDGDDLEIGVSEDTSPVYFNGESALVMPYMPKRGEGAR